MMHHPLKSNLSQGSRLAPLAAALFLLAGCATPTPPATAPDGSQVPPAPLAANPPPPPPAAPLTVEQAVQRTVARSRQTATLRAALEVARQRRRAATDFADPELRYDWGESRSGNVRNLGNAIDPVEGERAKLRVFVPNPWLMAPRVDARNADVQAAKADLQAGAWLVTCQVRQLFAELNFLADDVSLASDLARLDGEILKVVRSRAEQGAAPAADAVTAGRRLLQAQDDLDQVRHRYRLAEHALADLLNLPPDSLHIATNPLPLPSFPDSALPFDQAELTALRCRGDVAALHWRTLAAESDYRETRNVRLPWIKELRGSYEETSSKWWGGFAMDLPIFSLTKNHAPDALLAQYSLAEVNETEARRAVSREVRAALDELHERRRQAARYDGEAAPLLAEMRQTLATLQHTPNAMSDQVAAAELQLVEARRFDLGARWQYHLALLNLERVLGAPLSEAVRILPGS